MKKITLLTIVFLILSSFPVKLFALEQLTISLDKTIIKPVVSYKLPTKIAVVPIFLPASTGKISDDKWLKGIYYFTINKLGFNNIPFHYVVTPTGGVFSSSQGDERRIAIEGVSEDTVLIAYLTNTVKNTFDEVSEKPITDLLVDVANRNQINPENISLFGVGFERDSAASTIKMIKQDLGGLWQDKINQFKATASSQYNPTVKTFSVSVKSLVLPESAKAGDVVEGKLTIKNTGLNTIYGGTKTEIIGSKNDGSPSRFYANGIWLSQNQFAIMPEDKQLSPDQEETYTVYVKAPLYLGIITETFTIKTITGGNVAVDNNFDLSMNITKSDKRIVEITETGFGFLNVRAEPSTVGAETARVIPGERYFVLEEDPNGFLKIDMGEGQSGWVAGWYTRDI